MYLASIKYTKDWQHLERKNNLWRCKDKHMHAWATRQFLETLKVYSKQVRTHIFPFGFFNIQWIFLQFYTQPKFIMWHCMMKRFKCYVVYFMLCRVEGDQLSASIWHQIKHSAWLIAVTTTVYLRQLLCLHIPMSWSPLSLFGPSCVQWHLINIFS